MSVNESPGLQPARWHEDAQGDPVSLRFGDRYASRAGALAQARAVFLQGTGLPQRWQGRARFTVCELGFGLGHNFLATWQAWRDDPARCAHLHYLAIEAHPFVADDLRRAWGRLPADLRPAAQALLAAWPALLPGWHRLVLAEGALTLTLGLGDVHRLAWQAMARVDAFYLDGFAPRCNPAMWTPAVFGQLRRLAGAEARLATWCAAGQVRRDLREAGFLVHKAPGFGGKREMTVAVLRPGLGRPPATCPRQRVAVVGAGLAGAAVAHALARRGHAVSLWSDGVPATPGGAGHPTHWEAAVVPPVTPDDDLRARLARAGLAEARAQWLGLPEAARPRPCGALLAAHSAVHAHAQQQTLARLQFPAAWVSWLDATTAQARAGLRLPHGGLWLPQALQLVVPRLLAGLLQAPAIERHAVHVARVVPATASTGWVLHGAAGQQQVVDQVILANARGAGALLAPLVDPARWPVLHTAQALAGQLDRYAVSAAERQVPRCIVSGLGHGLPPVDGWATVGSTYVRGADRSVPTAAGSAQIVAQLRGWLGGDAPAWLGRGTPRSWAGWRLATRDHLPVIGPVPERPGLWLACAYGSRGATWAALAAALIGAHLDDEPLPLARDLWQHIRLR